MGEHIASHKRDQSKCNYNKQAIKQTLAKISGKEWAEI